MNEDRVPLPGPEVMDPTADAFPWPPATRARALESFVETLRRSSLEPAAFFRTMPRRAPLQPALLYLLIVGIIAAAARLFWSVSFHATWEWLLPAGELRKQATPVEALVDFLLTPVVVIATVFAVAALFHAALFVLGAARNGPGTTVRVLCYANGPGVLAVIPFVGELAGAVWTLLLAVVGLREAHETSTGRALAAVVLPFLLVSVLIGIVLALVALAGIAGR